MQSNALRSPNLAPVGGAITDYDRRSLAVYAALLDAEKTSAGWRDLAKNVLCIDPNAQEAEASVHSHLERARWIIGDGLASALAAFGRQSSKTDH